MSATLATMVARLGAYLMDSLAAVFDAATCGEALLQALDDYTDACPDATETVLTLTAAGREIAIDSLTDLITVTAVWWPFNSLTEEWPPNRVRGWRIWRDRGRPVLFLSTLTGAEPQTADELRLWYTVPHTINGLAGAAGTSVPVAHESMLITGAAGYALLARAVDQAETALTAATATPNYAAAGHRLLKLFRDRLQLLRFTPPATYGDAAPTGLRLDEWDDRWQGAHTP